MKERGGGESGLISGSPPPRARPPTLPLRLRVAAGHEPRCSCAVTGAPRAWNALGASPIRAEGDSGQCGAGAPCDQREGTRGSNGLSLTVCLR